MATQVYPPLVIIRTLLDSFFPYRGLTLAPRGLAPGGAPRAFSDDEIISDMSQFYYVRLDALRGAPPGALRGAPRGARDWVVVIILASDGKYAHHAPDLRKLLDGVGAERPAKEGRLEEMIVVAEEEFFKKKNLTDVIREMQTRTAQADGNDPLGVTPFYSAHPYHNFALVVPEHKSVPAHKILDPDAVREYLHREHLAFSDLPVILASDPPIVWLGGRKGQVVLVTRDSQIAGTAVYRRRIEKGAL